MSSLQPALLAPEPNPFPPMFIPTCAVAPQSHQPLPLATNLVAQFGGNGDGSNNGLANSQAQQVHQLLSSLVANGQAAGVGAVENNGQGQVAAMELQQMIVLQRQLAMLSAQAQAQVQVPQPELPFDQIGRIQIPSPVSPLLPSLNANAGPTPDMLNQAQQLQELLHIQQQSSQPQPPTLIQYAPPGGTPFPDPSHRSSNVSPHDNNNNNTNKRMFKQHGAPSDHDEVNDDSGLPGSVAVHLPLLDRNNPDGAVLRSYYELSMNDITHLPPVPSAEEYLAAHFAPPGGGNSMGTSPLPYDRLLPPYDRAALRAAGFAEIALGALANGQTELALSLSNGTVMCLRQCVQEEFAGGSSHGLFHVARAYLLHGIFRSFRGDMARYFKYRRVCLTHVLKLDNNTHAEGLLSTISFHDAWAYMLYNASEEALPDIDMTIPRLQSDNTFSGAVASNPLNQMWMQGAPAVFLNNEAPAINRSVDALACAIRSCCDQANDRFEEMAKAMGMSDGGGQCARVSPTTTAVMANQDELCSRNMVLSAQSLLNQHKGLNKDKAQKHGLTLVVTAMAAFLENADDPNASGMTDRQVKNLLKVCDIIVQNPLLLHSPGPVYHMVSNAAIMLCHLLNGLYTKINVGGDNSHMNKMMFDEVLDSLLAVRKILCIHRKALPFGLRCHGIPRPQLLPPPNDDSPLINMGDTLMCYCRGCQGFVLMGCSPCVAAERAAAASSSASNQNVSYCDEGHVTGKEMKFGEPDIDLNLDDDALLSALSLMIKN